MTTASTSVQEISIAHSPDSDDAFMFYGLATNKVRVPGFKFTHTLTDIETLNHKAMNEAFYDVTAISFHAYPYVQDNYTIMACGGSMGDGYGPMIVSPRKLTLDEVKKTRIAVPGTLTTAYLTLKLFAPDIQTVTLPFDEIIPQSFAESSMPASSSMKVSSPTPMMALSSCSTSASGGATRRTVCPSRWAATPSAGRSVRRCSTSPPLLCATASNTPSTTAKPPWSTRCSSLATWTPAWPTDLSECTSTSALSTTAQTAGKLSTRSSTWASNAASSPTARMWTSSADTLRRARRNIATLRQGLSTTIPLRRNL